MAMRDKRELRRGGALVIAAGIMLSPVSASHAFAHDAGEPSATLRAALLRVESPVPARGYRGLSEVTLDHGVPIDVLGAPRTAVPLETIGGSPAVEGHARSMAAILDDNTLQRGDVVIFPDGPKVFKPGVSAPPWTGDDFVDLLSARGLSGSARASLLALVGRVAPASGASSGRPVDRHSDKVNSITTAAR